MFLLHLAIFVSSFLLFLVELVAAKAMLPGFGGSYLVWSVSVTLFQGLLLLGYAFAHFGDRCVSPRLFYPLYALVLALPMALFPVELTELTTRHGDLHFVLDIVVTLLLAIGPGFFALAAFSVVIQKYLADSKRGQGCNPYILYATSNLGSFAAMIGYPFLVERNLDLDQQLVLWQAGYSLLFLVFLAAAAWLGRVRPERCRLAEGSGEPQDGKRRPRAAWLLLAAAPAGMFLAVTNIITFDLAAVPLLWILPLAIYLASFILTFKRKPWNPVWLRDRFALIAALCSYLFLLMLLSYKLPIGVLIGAHCVLLFLVCTICHGELNRLRPEAARYLPEFYIILALGGFAGSLVVNWITPLVSNTILEYGVALFLGAAALALAMREEGGDVGGIWPGLAVAPVLAAWVILLNVVGRESAGVVAVGACMCLALLFMWLGKRFASVAAALALVVVLAQFGDYIRVDQRVVHRQRNFYGIYTVYDQDGKRYLRHGTTIHGSQYLDPSRAGEALGYFHRTTPAGELMSSPAFSFPRTGVVGLGAGSLADYARPGQEFTFYELDPDNETIARQYFSLLALAAVDIEVVPGDARLSLADAPDGFLDLLVIDAFNSDSIPVHLLTREAIEEYMRCIGDDGLLLMHVSNKYLALERVVYAVARPLGIRVLSRSLDMNIHPDALACQWMVLTRNTTQADKLMALQGWLDMDSRPPKPVRPWTDRYSNILSVFR